MRAFTSSRARQCVTGRRSRTTAPPPGLLAADAVPPWATAMARTMASPRPVPPSSRDRPVSGRAEALERVRQEAGREAGAVVADLDAEVRAVRAGGEHDDRAARGEPQRVVQEVVDHLPDPVASTSASIPSGTSTWQVTPAAASREAASPGAARQQLADVGRPPAAG